MTSYKELEKLREQRVDIVDELNDLDIKIMELEREFGELPNDTVSKTA
jgi:hypothetical protein